MKNYTWTVTGRVRNKAENYLRLLKLVNYKRYITKITFTDRNIDFDFYCDNSKLADDVIKLLDEIGVRD